MYLLEMFMTNYSLEKFAILYCKSMRVRIATNKPGRRVIFAPRKITLPSAQLAANKKRII